LRPRDLIVVGAVVLVAGFAVADALRGKAEESEATAPTTKVQTGPTRLPGPQPQPDAPAGWPTGTLDGALVFTNADDCRIRVVRLAGGREQPLARFSGSCDLWAAPTGQRVAYGLGPSSLDGFVPFKLADLAMPRQELGGYRALFGVVLWSQDGQRVAWCGRRRVGFDLEIGGPARRLPTCPAAYTPDGRIAYAVGNELLVEGEVVHRADGGITYVHYGTDGSLGLVIDGKRVERWEDDSLAESLAIPRSLQGGTPGLRFDNCAAFFRENQPPVGGIRLLDLGCFGDDAPRFFQGTDAAWSPDGRWLAVAEPDAIVLHEVVSGNRVARWPAQASALAWRPR
jgi:WD40-like Beta Propeller Repeat